jgi:hypothetical protein
MTLLSLVLIFLPVKFYRQIDYYSSVAAQAGMLVDTWEYWKWLCLEATAIMHFIALFLFYKRKYWICAVLLIFHIYTIISWYTEMLSRRSGFNYSSHSPWVSTLIDYPENVTQTVIALILFGLTIYKLRLTTRRKPDPVI